MKRGIAREIVGCTWGREPAGQRALAFADQDEEEVITLAETSIEWTRRARRDGTFMPGYSFNAWWGCYRVSPACKHCYADEYAAFRGFPDLWEKTGPRRFFGDKHWNEPRKWNRIAEQLGEKHLVFCSSMADVAEDRRDLDPWRERLWALMRDTPGLIWLLLTKRPTELRRMAHELGGWPSNAWFGVTVETGDYLWRIEEALRASAAVTFVSYEPALEPVDFGELLGPDLASWLIIGTESGSRARPMPLEWAYHAAAQARRRRARIFMKQLDAELLHLGRRGRPIKDTAAFPPGLAVREFPAILEAA